MITSGVLLHEDEPLIAMEVEAILNDMGFDHVATFSSRQEANDWLLKDTPEFALLGFKLKDGRCIDTATTLSSRRIPFIVCSGFPMIDANEVFRNAPWIQKPFSASSIAEAFATLKITADLEH
jgi:DNA-binding response OmpR family regulator